MNNPAVHGDEYAQVQIEVPTHLSQTAKEKLQEYARACS
jgi:molecular chaperone DnaJ